MTVEEIKAYYANQLIIQYLDKPRARATIEAVVGATLMDLLPTQVQDAFNIDTAVGVQLDTLGKYIGIARTGYDFSGYVSLDDDDYRQVLKLKTIQNNSGSSLADIQEFLHTFFPDQIFVFDFTNMRIGYYVDTSLTTEVVEFFIMNGLLPKPMAVELSSTVYGPILDEFFGFRTYDHAGFINNPFNTYDSYSMTWPWLQYDDGLVP